MAGLFNPGFESGDTGWSKQDSWQILQSPPAPFGIRPGSVGSWQAVHVGHPAVPTTAIVNNAKIPCAAGQIITVTAWIYQSITAAAGGGSACVRLGFYDQNNAQVSLANGSLITTIGWSQSTATVTAPLGTDWAYVDVCIYNQTSASAGTQVDDLTISGTLNALTQLPDTGGYGTTASSPVLSTKLDGGAPRLRATQVGAIAPVNVQWTCNPQTFDYLQAFYRAAGSGSKPFVAKLILEGSIAANYVATIEPGSWRLISQQGLTYVQGATLNVLPSPSNIAYDQSLIDMFSLGNPLNLLSALANYVNVTIPSNI